MRTAEKGIAAVLLMAALANAPARQTSGSAPQRDETPCKYEQNCDCPVPGITVRWKAAYCMSLNETDDLEQQDVSACLNRADPRSVTRLSACQQNAHWKAQWCRLQHKTASPIRACVSDPKMIPRIVEFGAGG